MNKRILLVLAVLFIFALSACGNKTENEPKEEENKSEKVKEAVEGEEETETNEANIIADALLESRASADYIEEITKQEEFFIIIKEELISQLSDLDENWLIECHRLFNDMSDVFEKVDNIEAPQNFAEHKNFTLKSMEEYHNAYYSLASAITQEDDELHEEFNKSLEKAKLYSNEASEIMIEVTEMMEDKSEEFLQ